MLGVWSKIALSPYVSEASRHECFGVGDLFLRKDPSLEGI